MRSTTKKPRRFGLEATANSGAHDWVPGSTGPGGPGIWYPGPGGGVGSALAVVAVASAARTAATNPDAERRLPPTTAPDLVSLGPDSLIKLRLQNFGELVAFDKHFVSKSYALSAACLILFVAPRIASKIIILIAVNLFG